MSVIPYVIDNQTHRLADILNAMLAAETMTGRDGLTVPALPHDLLQNVMRKYNRLNL